MCFSARQNKDLKVINEEKSPSLNYWWYSEELTPVECGKDSKNMLYEF